MGQLNHPNIADIVGCMKPFYIWPGRSQPQQHEDTLGTQYSLNQTRTINILIYG